MKYVLAVLVLVLAIAGAFWMQGHVSTAGTPVATSTENVLQALNRTQTQTLAQTPRQSPPGQKEYKNEKYHFSLIIPENLTVKEYDEGAGAATITFQDIKNAQGFQIFVVPYADTQITEEQFKKDEPSGVRRDSQDITIDTASAVSFYSKNPLLGDTAEIWFIHGGYLYETTSLKPLASWLSDIMLTWTFVY